MININFIVLGKLKEKYMKEFSAEYEKRLSGYCKLTVTELEPVKLSDNPSEQEIKNALAKETQMIKAKIPKNSYVFSMCIEGKQMSSEELSKKLEDIALSGKNNITFITLSLNNSFINIDFLSSELSKLIRLSISPNGAVNTSFFF